MLKFIYIFCPHPIYYLRSSCLSPLLLLRGNIINRANILIVEIAKCIVFFCCLPWVSYLIRSPFPTTVRAFNHFYREKYVVSPSFLPDSIRYEIVVSAYGRRRTVPTPQRTRRSEGGEECCKDYTMGWVIDRYSTPLAQYQVGTTITIHNSTGYRVNGYYCHSTTIR